MSQALPVLVVGAGPSGMMAAEALADAGLPVVVAEAKPSPARKPLMAGKSGLNLPKDAAIEALRAQYENGGAKLGHGSGGIAPLRVAQKSSTLALLVTARRAGRFTPWICT